MVNKVGFMQRPTRFTVDKVKVLIEQNDEVITTDYVFIYYIQTDIIRISLSDYQVLGFISDI